MKKLNLSLIVFETIIFIAFFYTPFGTLSFGYGLGDLFYLIVYFVVLCIHVVWTLGLFWKKLPSKKYINPIIVFTVLLLIVLFKISFGRGSAFRWNNKIFLTENFVDKNRVDFKNIEYLKNNGCQLAEIN